MGADQNWQESYEAFRRGLLRHISIEERVLFPELRKRRGTTSLEQKLHRDHAAHHNSLTRTQARHPKLSPISLDHKYMITVDIHEAKKQLSRLVDRAARGEAFIIAKAGKPLVKVSVVDAHREPKRLGFLKGEIKVPDDFDRMGEKEIAALFGIGA